LELVSGLELLFAMFDESLAHFDSLFEILLNELVVKMHFS
jgi:hypothetical protein